MKSKIIKITLIVLAIAIVIGGFVAVSYINRPKVYDYYVKKDGKGDGLSAEAPVATITDVFEKSNEKVNKWDTVNVNFLYSEEETEMDIVISPKTVKSNVTIFIDNINMKDTKIQFGEQKSKTVFNKNLNIKAVKATKLNVIKDGEFEVLGDVQFIINNAIVYTDENSFEKLSINKENLLLFVSPEYIDFVNFTSKTGEFKIAEGYTAKAYTKDKKLVATSQEGVLKIKAKSGIYNIAVTKDDVAESDKYKDYIFYRGGYNDKLDDNKYQGALANTYSKLTKDKELKVVYFGGSVTSGSGASHGSYSWRGLIGEWLKNNFPEANITNCNKALGETGTHLGVYRLNKAVIEEKPDLLFLEYSINDFYDKASYERASTQFETIVRQVREKLPECDIVTILVIDQYGVTAAVNNDDASDGLHTQAKAHEYISSEYDIPTIHVGRAFVREFLPKGFKPGGEEWKEHVKDIVHPTDKGYMAYYTVIKEFMTNTLIFGDYGDCGVVEKEQAILHNKTLLDGNLTFFDPDPELKNINYPENFASLFTFMPERVGIFKNDNPEYVGVIKVAQSQEAYIEVEFEGTELIMLAEGVVSTAQYEVSIDGGDWQIKNYAGKNPVVMIRDIESGKHTARIRPSLSKDMYISGFYSADSAKASTRPSLFED